MPCHEGEIVVFPPTSVNGTDRQTDTDNQEKDVDLETR